MSTTMPKEGEAAPPFDLPAHPRGRVALADFRDKHNVILAFYPKDDTPGCTREMCGFSADRDKFAEAGAVVLGISCDDIASHRVFAAKYTLSITLLADADRVAGAAYGTVQGDRDSARRVLFVIDRAGIIRHVHQGMPDNAALLELLRGLG